MGYCQSCGAEIGPGLAKCNYCGAALAVPPPPPRVAHPMHPVGYAPVQQPMVVGVEQKSKLVAGLLAIFLGALGIHNFYLGFTGKAVTQLLITVCTCGYGGLIIGIWGLVEGIMILSGRINKDARGVPLKD